jgi:hypothetical protein
MPVLECFRRQPATAQGSDLGRLPVLGRASPQFRRQTHNRTRSAYVVNLKQVAASHWAVACPDLLEALVVARRGQVREISQTVGLRVRPHCSCAIPTVVLTN